MERDYLEFSNCLRMQRKPKDLLWAKREIVKGMGCISGIKHHIVLKEGVKQVCCPIRRRAPKEEEVERTGIGRLMHMCILEPAISAWGACNVFVPKKNCQVRVTSDFRALNNATVTDSNPI